MLEYPLFPKEALEETQADMCVQGDGEKVITSIKKAIIGEITFSEILSESLSF